MKVKVSPFKYSKAFYQYMNYYPLKNNMVNYPLRVICFIGVFVVFFNFTNYYKSAVNFNSVLIMFLFSVAFHTFLFVAKNNGKLSKRYLKNNDLNNEYEFTILEDKIIRENKGSRVEINKNKITKVVEISRGYIISLNDVSAMFIPKEALSAVDIKSIFNNIQEDKKFFQRYIIKYGLTLAVVLILALILGFIL